MTRAPGPDQLRAWADASTHGAFELLTRHRPDGRPAIDPRRFGGAVAYATGRRSAFFNPVIVLEPAAADDVRAALAWVQASGDRPSLRLDEQHATPGIAAVAREFGLVRDAWVEPGLVLTPIAVGGGTLPAGLRISEATPETMDAFYLANWAGFDVRPDRGPAVVRDLTPPSLVEDPDIRLFGGEVDGRPAACSMAIRTGEVVGVYSVGTAIWARRRGVGAAMTRAAIDAGLAWGCVAATLQASEMGDPIYRKMGFVDATRYALYMPVKQPQPEAAASA